MRRTGIVVAILLAGLLRGGAGAAGAGPAAPGASSGGGDSGVRMSGMDAVHDWDFAVSDQGFTTATCDDTGGVAVWAWGACTVAGAPGNVWGTVLAGNYPQHAGQRLLSPPFAVTAETDTMEVLGYVHTETRFDGGNVKVNGTVLEPTVPYPDTISANPVYHAFCVDNQRGFTGNSGSGPSLNWAVRRFDLSAYTGQTIQVEFHFGSDSSVAYPGWYLGYVRVGGGAGAGALQGPYLLLR